MIKSNQTPHSNAINRDKNQVYGRAIKELNKMVHWIYV
ncbi:hypothetical protein LLB_3181 [Legionella longbeachae D-4968]|nr:hypothetical protein LLB_3181 [Legionella longbeachae D-4968]